MNQKLNYDESLPPQTYYMLGTRKVEINLYKSKKPNPLFISEKGVEKVTGCELDLKKNYPIGEEIKIYVYCGGTCLDIKAVHEKSGEKISVTLNYEN